METNIAIDPNYELWVLLQQACSAMSRARENELREFGISRMQAAVLFRVKITNGPVTPAEISRWLFREPHTVSGLLDRMEKQGLIRKVRDMKRKNQIRVVITDKGEGLWQRSSEMKVVHSIMSSLSPKQRDALRPYLETLRSKALKELGVKQPLPFP